MGSVYFVKHKNMSPIKIGYTKDKNPKSRFSHYKTYSPYGMDFLGFIDFENVLEAISFERKIHDFFNEKRLKGEWFDLDFTDIECFVKENKKEIFNKIKKSQSTNSLIVVNLFKEDKLTPKIISNKVGISIQRVYDILRKNNLKKSKKNEALILYKRGFSVKEISEKLGFTIQHVYKKIKQ